MELSFNELKKRDVINIADGRCLGRIIDIKLLFPEGKLVGIVVPGRNVKGIFRCFDKTQLYIEERKIIKIGGDVILVNIKCCDERPRPVKPKPNPCNSNNRCSPRENATLEQFSASFENISEEDY